MEMDGKLVASKLNGTISVIIVGSFDCGIEFEIFFFRKICFSWRAELKRLLNRLPVFLTLILLRSIIGTRWCNCYFLIFLLKEIFPGNFFNVQISLNIIFSITLARTKDLHLIKLKSLRNIYTKSENTGRNNFFGLLYAQVQDAGKL